MYTTETTIYERNGWRLVSFGNGAAYALHCGSKSCFFQGDDAEAFRERTMDADGWLVDNCEERFDDYSDVMTDDHRERCTCHSLTADQCPNWNAR